MFSLGRNRLAVLLPCVLFALALVGASCTNRETAKREHLKRGEELLAQKNYPAAILEFRSAQQLDDNLAAAYWGLSRAYEGNGDITEAITALRRTVELDPNNLDAQVKFGTYAMLGKQSAEAGRVAEEVLRKNPNFVPAHILLASVYTAQQQYELALKELNRALELEPQRGETYMSLAGYYSLLDKPQQAEENYRRALAVNDRHVPAHIAYGNFLTQQQRLAEAEAEFKRASELNPDDPQVSYTLAGFYVAYKQLDKAEAIYKQVAEQHLERPDARAALAGFYASAGRVDESLKLYQETLARWPDYDKGRFQLSEVMLLKSDFKGALAQIQEILKRNPNNSLGLTARANIYLLTGKNNEAAEDAKKVLDQNPRAPIALQFLTDALLRAGQYAEARSAADRFVLYYPNNIQARVLQAQATLWVNDPKKALEQTNTVLDKLNEGHANGRGEIPAPALVALKSQVLTTRALAKAKLKNLSGARADMQAAVDLMPNSSVTYTNLAFMTSEANPGEATHLFEKALEFNTVNLRALRGVVSLYIAQHQIAQAHARVDHLLASYPNDVELHFLKAQIYSAESKPADAERELLRIQEINPDYAAAYYALAETYMSLKQPEQALGEFQQLIKREQASAYTYTLMGTIEEGQNNYAAAVQCYQKALELQPQMPIAANNLAWLYAAEGKGSLYEAARLAQIAVDQQPDMPNFLHTSGYVYLKLRMFPQSISQFRKAVALDQNNPAHHEQLSLALEGSGARDEAVRELEKAQRLKQMKRSEAAKGANKSSL
jgi:tetratricopeptide (TPR) repeat protein